MTEDWIGEVNFGIDGRYLIDSPQMSMPNPNTDGNEQKTQNENGGQTQIENNSEGRIIRAAMAEDSHHPETDQRQRRGTCDCAADQAYGVVPEKQDRPQPV